MNKHILQLGLGINACNVFIQLKVKYNDKENMEHHEEFLIDPKHCQCEKNRNLNLLWLLMMSDSARGMKVAADSKDNT